MSRKKKHKDLSPLEIEIRKSLKIAKQLGYTTYFPEIKQALYNSTSQEEISRIMCTYRHYMINKELKDKDELKERTEIIWIKR